MVQQENAMIKAWKVAALAVFAAASIASPALAQGYYTGSDARIGYGAYAYAGPRAPIGYGAYGAIPPGGGRYNPALTGGGNLGSNWAVEHDN
jgi:hypothetical protein